MIYEPHWFESNYNNRGIVLSACCWSSEIDRSEKTSCKEFLQIIKSSNDTNIKRQGKNSDYSS